ncbi:MAG: DUF7002 family protein [Gemmobacter sp.]
MGAAGDGTGRRCPQGQPAVAANDAPAEGAAAFARAVGGRLVHVTAAANLPRIRAEGLHPAADLARAAGIDPAAIRLRAAPVALPGALLNHQRPLRMGRRADFLDPGLTLDAWAALLDARVFLWPARRGAAFAASLRDRGAVALSLDPVRLFAALAPCLWLSPINSGDASRRPARRGPWLWLPAARLDDFPANRMRRALARRPDRVAEVSVTGHIAPDLIAFPDGA